MKRLSSILFVSALSLVSANAATIFTDGLPTATDVYNTTTAGNFTATTGNVDIVQASGLYGFLCGTAATCIDLNGNTQGTITSGPITFAAGTYTLSFTLGNPQRGTTGASTTVSLGSLLPTTTYADPQTGTITQTFTVASSTTASLIFASNIAGPQGDILSKVSIVTASAVPEPSSLLLMSLPLLAFGARLRRKA